MPVQKFRNMEDWQRAKDQQWLACDDPSLPQRIRLHWQRWSRLVPLHIPHGVKKYRSLDEAEADRERWEDERVAHLRAERLHK
jgi:hypothetical protein